MKKMLLSAIVSLFVYGTLLAQSCLQDGITFQNQSQIDDFPINYPGCTEILGYVTIGTFSPISDIKDLSPLNGITRINGGLIISSNDSLLNLLGLGNLTFVGNNLQIAYNDNLASLTGLNNLAQLFTLQIEGNEALTGLSALESLVSATGIYIAYSPNITNLDGLQNLQSLTYLSINYSDAFADFYGAHNLTSLGRLTIEYNPALVNLEGLENLTDLSSLSLTGNSGLTEISALSGITSIGSIIISDNTALTSLAGLENLTDIHYTQSGGGSLGLSGNTRLQDLSGFSSLQSIDGYLSISNQDSLVSLAGLENLSDIGENLFVTHCDNLESLDGIGPIDSLFQLVIQDNPRLTSLAGLSNLEYLNSDNYCLITENPMLSGCAIEPICNLLQNNSEYVVLTNNGTGCNTIFELELNCGAEEVQALVLIDEDGDCEPDDEDTPVADLQVHLSSANQLSLRETDTDGIARFGYLDVGPLALSFPQFPNASWAACQDTVWMNPDTLLSEPQQAVLLLQALDNCPKPTVELGLPPHFRGCLINSNMQVAVQNIGGGRAEGVKAFVIIPDALMEVVATSPQMASHIADTLYFEIGELNALTKAKIDLTVRTRCDTFLLGQTICLTAKVGFENSCEENPEPFSEISIEPRCIGDTLARFTLKNIGNAPTQAPHDYVIIEDEVVLFGNSFNLDPDQAFDVDLPATGATYRIEATQFDNGDLTSAAIENCGGLTPGFITAYWIDQGGESYDYDCRIVNQAFDPNQKTAVPTGVGDEHLLAANRPIDYTIEFQNTGTDTAFRVQLLDALSPHLDINTFRPGFSSHPYSWEIRGGDTLEVLFYPIALPDSTTNEAASKGFFSYSIDQKPDLPDGTLIENTASIIFDFNPPIVTNTVFHTIGRLIVKVDEPQSYPQLWKVLGNPTNTTAVFECLEALHGENRFGLYDANGRLMRADRFFGQQYAADCSDLPGGIYFFRIVDAKGRPFSGKLIVAE